MTDYTQLMLAQLAPQFAAATKPRDPYAARRSFGLNALQQGTSTKPVGSWVEGLARALQGGLGGYLTNQANEDQDAEEKGNAQALATALQTPGKPRLDAQGKPVLGPDGKPLTDPPDPQAIAAALSRIRGMEGAAATLGLASILQGRDNAQATSRMNVYGPSPAPLPPMPGGAPPSAGTPTSSAPGAGGQFNVGNILAPGRTPGPGAWRTYDTPEAAVAGVRDNLRAYPAAFNGGQPMSILQIAPYWSKGVSQLDADSQAWARNVALTAGIDPNQPIDFSNPQIMARVAKGIHVAEFGQGKTFPDEVYLRGVTGGQRQPAPAGPPPAAAPDAVPPQAPPSGGLPGQPPPTGMAPPLPPPQPVPLPFVVDDGSRDRAYAERLRDHLARFPNDAQAQKDFTRFMQSADEKRLAAQQRLYDRQFKPPERVTTQDGTVAPVTGGAADPNVIKGDARAKAAGSGEVEYFTDDKGNRWEVNLATKAMKPASEPDRTTVVTGAGGYPVQRDQSGKETPVAGPGAPFNEGQGKAAVYADRMTNSADALSGLERFGLSPGNSATELNVWGVGVPFKNWLQSPEYQRYARARDDWINAKLRRELGATIRDEEFLRDEKIFFPQPGDSAGVVADKARARAITEQGMAREAGPAYKPRDRQPVDVPPGAPTPRADAPQRGARPTPPPAAIDELKANPGSRAQFDEVFGPGAADRALGGR